MGNVFNHQQFVPHWQISLLTDIGLLFFQILPQDILQKYITYAKMHVHPFLHDVDLEKMALVYADLRRESMVRP